MEIYDEKMSGMCYDLCKQTYVEKMVAASELEYISSMCGKDGLRGNILSAAVIDDHEHCSLLPLPALGFFSAC